VDHTQRNLAYAPESGREFAGEDLQAWLAYNIRTDKRSGIGNGSDAQLASDHSSAHAQDRGASTDRQQRCFTKRGNQTTSLKQGEVGGK
jgi:hypothetical protein